MNCRLDIIIIIIKCEELGMCRVVMQTLGVPDTYTRPASLQPLARDSEAGHVAMDSVAYETYILLE